jgi:hypothetical protein
MTAPTHEPAPRGAARAPISAAVLAVAEVLPGWQGLFR